MKKGRWLWGLIVLATAVNVLWFVQHWTQLPLAWGFSFLPERTVSSLVCGIGLAAALLSFFSHLLGRRWLRALLLLGGVAGVVGALWDVKTFDQVFPPVMGMTLAGACVGAICFRMREDDQPHDTGRLMLSFLLYTFASINLLLAIGPYTTFTPGYIQDGISPPPSLAYFYYGSVHSDISVVSAALRRLINFFFGDFSISATTLSSVLLVSLGLAFAALAVQLVYGAMWGWLLIVAAWSDRWLLASGISSSVVSHPILSAGAVVFLAAWALTRAPGILSWRETWLLGAFNAGSVIYNLYSYSAARVPWVIGSAVAALVLLLRGAVPLNAKGAQRILAAMGPSVAVVAAILFLVFGGNVERFKAQLFISPRAEQIIKNVNDYHVKVVPMHDVDMPIWWGTGRPEGINVCLYWPRTPGEIAEKAAWFMGELAQESPVAPYLLVLGAVALIVGLLSPAARHRHFTAIAGIIMAGAFAPFILAQDTSAYRRGLSTDLLVLVLVVGLFASKGRPGRLGTLSAALGFAFCALKGQLEVRAVFNKTLHTPLCIVCPEHFNARALANDPIFQSVSQRPLRFIMDGKGVALNYSRCASLALETYEMKKLAPKLSVVTLGQRAPSEEFAGMQPGDVMVLVCPSAGEAEGESKAACAGQPPFGRWLGTVIDPNDEQHKRPKWVFIEK